METIRKVGRYELLELLGRGGMADVYLAHVSGIADFKRLFAVKMIRTDLPEWERYGQFFIDEARITVQMRHPNIVQVFDLGMSDYGPYLGMEYVDGPDLRQLIGWSREMRKGVPFNLSVFIARELLQSLAYAHEAAGDDGLPLGIVHRDISPSNVLLSTSGEVKLSDFGVAMATIATQAQGPGAVVGKARYFAPEVARREPATPRSDQFSLGAVLFDLFTGQSLIEGEQYTEIVANLEVFDVRKRLDNVFSLPLPLEEVFQRALASEARDRFDSVRMMLDHLDDFMYEQGIRVKRADLAEYLEQLEEYIIGTESESLSSVSPQELSSVWTSNRSDGARSAVPADRRGRGKDLSSTAPPARHATGRSGVHANRRTGRVSNEVSLPSSVAARQQAARNVDAASQSSAPARAQQSAQWDQGGVLALPEADEVKLCDPVTGPVVLTEEQFDERIDHHPPLPDTLIAFDGGELRPFHEWARMGNPRTTIRSQSTVLGVGPLTVGPTLLKLAAPNSGPAVIQLFDGRLAIGLIADGDRLHGVWTDTLGIDLLAHLTERDVISRSQCQVLQQLANGQSDLVPELAARHGILSTVRLFHEARGVVEAQLERALTWPTWRISRIKIEAEGWGSERAGVGIRGALERAAQKVFSVDWFMGLMPDMMEATIRPRQREVTDRLDQLLGKGTLRVKRDLPPGSTVGTAVASPSGDADEVRTGNLYQMVVGGALELAAATQTRDFRRTMVKRDA